MSKLTYNGIVFGHEQVRTHAIDFEPIYSEDGVDYLYTHVTIGIQATLNAGYPYPTMGGETTPTQIMRRIRSCLMQPRRLLSFEVNGEVLVLSPQEDNTSSGLLDAKNGPKPIKLTITPINGSKTFIIEYTIETWLSECCSATAGTPGNPPVGTYLSHRWSETLEADEKFYTTRRLAGKLALRASALVHAATVAATQATRWPLPPGFERRASKWTVSEDGLTVLYDITDVEVYKVAPEPAVKWEGRVITSTSNGAQFVNEAVIKMWGHKYSRKKDMIARAIIIAIGRLFPGQNVPALPNYVLLPRVNNGVLVGGAVSELLHENVIEVRVRCMHATLNQTLFGMLPQLQNSDIDDIKGVDAEPRPNNYQNAEGNGRGIGQQYDRGSINVTKAVEPPFTALRFVDKYIFDPCLRTFITTLPAQDAPGNGIVATGSPELPPGDVLPQEIIPAEVSVVAMVPTDFDPEEYKEGVYLDYSIDTDYLVDQHIIQLPLCSSNYKKSTSFASLAQPTMMKIVRWSVTKLADEPTIPDPNLLDPNNVLLHHSITPAAPYPLPDGQNVSFTISGVYVYGVKEASEARYIRGQYPFFNTDDSEKSLPRIEFEKGLLDANGGDLALI